MFDVYLICDECEAEIGFEYDDAMRMKYAMSDNPGNRIFLCSDCEAQLKPVWHRD